MQDNQLRWRDMQSFGEHGVHLRYSHYPPKSRRVYVVDTADGTYIARLYTDSKNEPQPHRFGPFDTLEAAKTTAEMLYHTFV